MEITNKKNIFLKYFLLFFLILIFLFLIPEKQNSSDIKYVKIAGQIIKIELALTSKDYEQGLAGRVGLNEGEGMLFVFKNEGSHFFWMKGMNFPLDIIWIDKDLKVVDLKKDARPESYPTTYGSLRGAMYVLEVVAGFSEKYNLKEGDKVEFVY